MNRGRQLSEQRPAAALVATLACLACGESSQPEPLTLLVAQAPIDVGAGLEASPGEGVGAHFSVDSDGEWEVFFTCDSVFSGYACEFDAIVSVELPATLEHVDTHMLGRDDAAWRIDSGALQVLAYTDYERDTVRFAADPGEPLRVDVLVDGAYLPETFFWIGGGRVRSEAPSTPFELVPVTNK